MGRLRAAALIGLSATVALVAGLTVGSAVPPAEHRADEVHTQPLAKRQGATAKLLTEAQCVATPSVRIPCYDPAQVQAAYGEPSLFAAGVKGGGQTIVIVDSFGSPTIRADLAMFDAQFKLPAPPSFRIIQPAGAVPAYNPRTTTMVGWAGETTLDVEWAHAIAPGSSILLVETPVSETEGTVGFPQIVAAENYVIAHQLGNVISQSFGANEHTFSSLAALKSLRSAYEQASAAGITVLAATGDTGATDYATATAATYSTVPAVTWPASDPLVTAVGGTQLSLNAAGQRTAPDRVWNDSYSPVVNDFVFGTSAAHPNASGGGLSSAFSRPSYQEGVARVVGNHRGIPDISMSAACSGLVDTYQSFGGPTSPGWYYVCGTSEATPIFAGIVALADQEAHHGLGLINPALYAMEQAHDPGIVDITQGNNTVSFSQNGAEHTVVGSSAAPGYDLASGVGTVNAALFVPELVRTQAAVGTAVTYSFLPANI